MEDLSRRALLVMGGVAAATAIAIGWPANIEARTRHHRPLVTGIYSNHYPSTY